MTPRPRPTSPTARINCPSGAEIPGQPIGLPIAAAGAHGETHHGDPPVSGTAPAQHRYGVAVLAVVIAIRGTARSVEASHVRAGALA